MNCELLIRNCMLHDVPSDIMIDGGIIRALHKTGGGHNAAAILDADGKTAVPGLIDIHIQGAGGADVLDGAEEALATMSKTLARLGTTSFLATTVVKPATANAHIRETARLVGADLGGAECIGIHLEGPFINPDKRGGIAREAVLPPSARTLDDIIESGDGRLSMMTLAPELDGADTVIRALVGHGITASIGHTLATYEETLHGIDTGISHATHIFNAMPGLHHRTPGPIPAILERTRMTFQLIGDGVHVHPAIVRMLYRQCGPERIAAITDGVQAMGLPEGRYIYNGREYESKNGTARYPDGTLIGSALSLRDIVEHMADYTGASFFEALAMATEVPAAILGLSNRKGALKPGMDADIVVLDDDLSVMATIVRGRIMYERSGS